MATGHAYQDGGRILDPAARCLRQSQLTGIELTHPRHFEFRPLPYHQCYQATTYSAVFKTVPAEERLAINTTATSRLLSDCRLSTTMAELAYGMKGPGFKSRPIRIERGENGAAPECNGQGNGRSPRKPADQRHRPAQRKTYCMLINLLTKHPNFTIIGTAVTERLHCSPPSIANRVQFPVGSLPDFRKCKSCRKTLLVSGVFSGISRSPRPCIPALLHSHLISPPSAFKTSLLRAVQISQFNFTILVPAATFCWPNVWRWSWANVGKCKLTQRQNVTRPAYLPPSRTGFNPTPGHSQIFACGNRAGRCRCSVGVLRVIPSPLPFNFGTALYSPQSPSLALKTSLLIAAQISSLTHLNANNNLENKVPILSEIVPLRQRRAAWSMHTPAYFSRLSYLDTGYPGARIVHKGPIPCPAQSPHLKSDRFLLSGPRERYICRSMRTRVRADWLCTVPTLWGVTRLDPTLPEADPLNTTSPGAQGRQLNMKEVLTNLLRPVPWALANDDGTVRKTNRAVLRKELEKIVSPAEVIHLPAVIVIHGMSIVHKVKGLEEKYFKITLLEWVPVIELRCTHEEADKRIMFHALCTSHSGATSVAICCEDTDVLILSLGFAHLIPSNLYFKCGTQNHVRYIDVSKLSSTLGRSVCDALVGLHAFTGSDSVSVLAGRGKLIALKQMIND
ncbi:hypothetical protein PR048_008083 [Dryococelus australis]|uniref:Uncharacterized protein n=1 Tax=Dryococelus australis TaxID=614101 RepID=A0ABQ9HWW4_9NEOP|nr:hypothetical protein PR048_008083 [Dryococelus australis]